MKVKITLRGIALQTEENEAPFRSPIRLTLRSDLWHTAELYYPNGGVNIDAPRWRKRCNDAIETIRKVQVGN